MLYANGWDASPGAPSSGTFSLHHPGGAVMKIAFDDDRPTSSAGCTYDSASTHWQIYQWDENDVTDAVSVTAGGSSGAPRLAARATPSRPLRVAVGEAVSPVTRDARSRPDQARRCSTARRASSSASSTAALPSAATRELTHGKAGTADGAGWEARRSV